MPPRGRLLVLTEGPFDALKLNLLGNAYGIWATCCMTSDFSPHQRAQLYGLLPASSANQLRRPRPRSFATRATASAKTSHRMIRKKYTHRIFLC